jgi:putative transposase
MKPKHYITEAHAHHLTFSCYKNMSLFKDPTMYSLFLQSLNRARNRLQFSLLGFVIMPNHVHLLIFPNTGQSISSILTAIKQPFSHRALNHMRNKRLNVYNKLMVKKGTKPIRRFWQTGGGYDRNIYKDETLIKTLEYMHFNPVKNKLVNSPSEWKWSSARFYETGEQTPIAIEIPDWWQSIKPGHQADQPTLR